MQLSRRLGIEDYKVNDSTVLHQMDIHDNESIQREEDLKNSDISSKPQEPNIEDVNSDISSQPQESDTEEVNSDISSKLQEADMEEVNSDICSKPQETDTEKVNVHSHIPR